MVVVAPSHRKQWGIRQKMKEYTKYEHARIIGARALQISMGAPFLIKLDNEDLKRMHFNTIEIAKLEFNQGLIPIEIKKPIAYDSKKETPAKTFDQTKME